MIQFKIDRFDDVTELGAVFCKNATDHGQDNPAECSNSKFTEMYQFYTANVK